MILSAAERRYRNVGQHGDVEEGPANLISQTNQAKEYLFLVQMRSAEIAHHPEYDFAASPGSKYWCRYSHNTLPLRTNTQRRRTPMFFLVREIS